MPEDWLSLYLDYTKQHEAPTIFHKWIGISVILACLERRVWLAWADKGAGEEDVFIISPHEYIILIAGSGRCRKTMAITIGEKLLKRLQKPLPIFAEQATKESIVTFMHSQTTPDKSVLFLAPELTTFVDKLAIQAGILPFLTRLYDAPDEWAKGTIARGLEKLKRVCVNILAATTPKELRRVFPPEAISGGFLSRVIQVYAEEPRKRDPHPVFSKQLRIALMRKLNAIRELTGPVVMSEKTDDYYCNWYKEMVWPKGSPIDGYYARKPSHVLKIAIAFAASRLSLQLTEADIKAAIALLEITEPRMLAIMETMETTPQGELHAYVLKKIANKGSIGHSKLLNAVSNKGIKARDLTEIINTLRTAGQIKSRKTGKCGGVSYVICDEEDLE